MKGLVTYSISIIAGISISLMATILAGIIVDTTTGFKENINDATKMDDVENVKSPSKYHKPMLLFRKSSFLGCF